jgi:integrase
VTIHKASKVWEARRVDWLCTQSFASMRMDEIDTPAITAWKDARLKEVAGSTIVRDMNLLSHVFTVARDEWHWIEHNPCSKVRRPESPPARRRRVSDFEVAMVYVAAGRDLTTVAGRVALAFEFAIETACRGGEICGLRPEHMHATTIHLPKTKNGDTRDVPLSERAQAILAMVPNGFELTSAQKDAMFRKIVKRTPIVGLHFHDSRAEAIWRLSKRLSVLELAQVVGHRDLNELMSYYRADAVELAVKLRRDAV